MGFHFNVCNKNVKVFLKQLIKKKKKKMFLKKLCQKKKKKKIAMHK